MKPIGDKGPEELLPDVTEDDVREIEGILAVSFDQPRREVLQSNQSFDTLACPGSGKTTLLVAKLAIMARKWPHAHRGICVLSHTNVARQEIEQKLAGTTAGERLLSYPHYVGTIHGFVNTFLALPLLRSEGRKIKFIDDDACGRFCYRLLQTDQSFSKARAFLKRRNSLDKTIRSLRYVGKNLDLESAGGELPCGPSTTSFACLLSIKNAAASAGLWRFDDMFAFAERLLESYPTAIQLVRWRFPAFFADEMQDTSEAQSRVLSRIFPPEGCVIRQRFGDSNQAIYDQGQVKAGTDVFPGKQVREIANSQRFDSSIANKAGPLAPHQQQLIGNGPPRAMQFRSSFGQESMPHTVFIFGSNSVRGVFPAFAHLLIDTFSAETLKSDRFLARAIGRVGKGGEEEHEKSGKFPRGLSDYWPGYVSEATKPEPRPACLADFIHLAQRQRTSKSDLYPSVVTAARGIIELLSRAPLLPSVKAVRDLRGLRESLRSHPHALHALESLLWQWCVEAKSLREQEWKTQLNQLRLGLAPLLEERKVEEATEFCRWSTSFADGISGDFTGSRGLLNRYRFPEKEPLVEIDIGTIHSAKGQTHTATLVVETFFHHHDLEDLLPWLIGEKRGLEKSTGDRRLDRMRCIYTAMTRPSHLLCLAMREQALAKASNMDTAIEAFQSRGWKIKLL
jgi:DNA helicase-2/ATP-dependent DNA helicase PcrA